MGVCILPVTKTQALLVIAKDTITWNYYKLIMHFSEFI